MSPRENGICALCDEPKQHPGATHCDSCWEITRRLSGFLTKPKAVQYVCQELARIDHRFGCLKNVAPDEPVFILKAKDALSPVLVSIWRIEAEKRGTPASKLEAASRVCEQMILWGATNGTKVSD